MQYYRFIINAFFLNIYFWIFSLFLQNINGAEDTESWSSIGYETKLPYSFKLELEQGLRFKDQLSSFKQTHTDISISYNIIDGMKIFIPIRYTILEDKIKKRFSIGSSYKYNLKPINIKFRIKFQRNHEDDEFSKDVIRNKISIDYKINKIFKPYISNELFYLYELNQYKYDEYRTSFGIYVNLPKKKEMKIFYTYKMEDITKKSPDQINIFGIAYNFK